MAPYSVAPHDGWERAEAVREAASRANSRARPGQDTRHLVSAHAPSVSTEPAPSAGFEPAHTAPEADALSPELRGQGGRAYRARGSEDAGRAGGSSASSVERAAASIALAPAARPYCIVRRLRTSWRARPRRRRDSSPLLSIARAHCARGSIGAPSSRTASIVASTAPTSPRDAGARPIVRRPSRMRCTSSSSVSGNASTASRRGRRGSRVASASRPSASLARTSRHRLRARRRSVRRG